MNVNVHTNGGKFWSLGMVRVRGSMPAAKCVELLVTKLGELGLSLEKDIVCICRDDASVMWSREVHISRTTVMLCPRCPAGSLGCVI